MSTVDYFERDLLDGGMPAADAGVLRACYARALKTRSISDWIELYVGTFATLHRHVDRMRTANPAAVERLLRLVNDDLGSKLFEPQAREEVAVAARRAQPA